MEIVDTLKFFKYFNTEFANFDEHSVDPSQVPVVTGILKQDAFLAHIQNCYGVILYRDEPANAFSKWDMTVVDDKKFSWLALKI